MVNIFYYKKNALNFYKKKRAVDGKTYIFADFIVMQEKEITRMKASGLSMKQCFGF